MSFTVFDFAGLPVSRWRNGGGETREIACWPVGGDDFAWRASIATIEQDGPFSLYPDIDRSITLLTGDGIVLSSPGLGVHKLSNPLQTFAFPGDVPVNGRLLGGEQPGFQYYDASWLLAGHGKFRKFRSAITRLLRWIDLYRQRRVAYLPYRNTSVEGSTGLLVATNDKSRAITTACRR